MQVKNGDEGEEDKQVKQEAEADIRWLIGQLAV